MSGAFDPAVSIIKEEMDSEPWAVLREVDSTPLGEVKCDMPQQQAARSPIKQEIDNEEPDLLQQSAALTAVKHEIDIEEHDPLQFRSQECWTPSIPSEPWGILQEVHSPPLGDNECDMLQQGADVKIEVEIDIGQNSSMPNSGNEDSPATSQLIPSGTDKRPRGTLKMKPTGEKPFQCTECKYRCRKRSELTYHVRKHTGEKPYKCDQCEYKCTQKKRLTVHRRLHVEQKPFNEQLYKTVKHEEDIEEHDPLQHPRAPLDSQEIPATSLLTPTAEPSSIEQEVSMMTATLIGSADHVQSGAEEIPRGNLKMKLAEEKPFKCTECEYRCRKRSELTYHTRKHTGEKPYKCDQCEYTCTQKKRLTVHRRTHTEEKPFKCDQCNNSFNQSSHLKNHLRTHTGEKPFKCDQCDFSYSHSNNLIIHLRTHTGEKPYKCNQCESSFRQRSNLTSHLKTHTGEKPYKCDQCEYRCNQKYILKRHLRIHTAEKPFLKK